MIKKKLIINNFNFIFSVLLCLSLTQLPAAFAQDDDLEELERIQVTGTRIKKAQIEGISPVLTISRQDIERSGLTSVGDILQRLTASGSALNTKFNSSGNFGFPPDGSGIGAGATEVDLRHLGSNRALVLVDGIRWVNGSSASGVGSAADINTIPISIVDRIEVLEDGASSIYGSDAIAGVINIITKSEFDGAEINIYGGAWDEGDGETGQVDISFGKSDNRHSVFFNASYSNQEEIKASDRSLAQFPTPGTGVTRGSSGTPQGRFVFTDPNTNNALSLALNPGVSGIPLYDPLNPGGALDDFNPFDNSDRFNFATYNLVLTPSERTSLYGQTDFRITDNIFIYAKGLYSNRESVNQAAPEPIFLGPGAGTGGLPDTVSIDVTNPYNPFGFTLDASNNLGFLGRRPLEGGPRIFTQDVDTLYFGTGVEGIFDLADRTFLWDVNFAYSKNQADQIKQGGYNVRKMITALGPIDACNADPACVPLNLFGGQGANGEGTITQEMLDYVSFIQKDFSENKLRLWSANITGDIFELPAGPLAFAAGYERRYQSGSFQPDPIVVAGDTNGITAQPTSGKYDVDEFYAEFNVPILSGMPGAELLDLTLAIRSSDYSTFGSETTAKYGFRYQPIEDLLFRGTFAEGFRAPSIGELFGTETRFDAQLADLCSDFNNTGVSQQIIDNCIALGAPADGSFTQLNPQITVATGGSAELKPETSDSYTLGAVYSPSWAEDLSWASRLDFEFTYYNHELDDAIQAVDAQTQLDGCIRTLDPIFCNGINRNATGAIAGFNNTLTNIGKIETDGFDFHVFYNTPEFSFGQFGVTWNNTIVSEYTEFLVDPSQPGGLRARAKEGLEENDSAIPEWQSTLTVDWAYNSWGASWTMRYIDEVTESCSDFLDGTSDSFTNLGLCSNPDFNDNTQSLNKLDATFYNDLQVSYMPKWWDLNWTLSGGINNVFDEDPPTCLSCSLNGYDASNYDIQGRFWYLKASLKM